MNVGDYVTQNDNFNANWICDKFSEKITKIYDDVVVLEHFISVTSKQLIINDNKPARVLSLNKCYLKLDVIRTRNAKLLNINKI